jgi:hypothetical protein
MFFLTLIGKSKETEDASHVGRRATSGTTVQIWLNPTRGGAKARRLQVSKLRMTLQAKMNLKDAQPPILIMLIIVITQVPYGKRQNENSIL